MEFVALDRYATLSNPVQPDFETLRSIPEKLELTQHLELVDSPENMARLEHFARLGYTVVPVRRIPPTAKFLNREGFPRRVLFEMTSRCNFLCRMCPQQKLTRPRMDMDGGLYRKVLDDMDAHGIEGLWIYHLGESLLHPEFEDNIRHISQKKNLGVVWMSTNGQYFTEEKINTVLQSSIQWINFSAHAITKETYQQVAPQGDFETVQKHLFQLYDMKRAMGLVGKPPFIHTQMIEQEVTAHEVDGFIARHTKFADIVSVNMLEYVGLPNNKFGMAQRERKTLSTCTRVSRSDCFIFSNGEVTLCDGAYNGEISLGNVNQSTLAEIWTGPKRRRILTLNQAGRMDEIPFCQTCTDYDI